MHASSNQAMATITNARRGKFFFAQMTAKDAFAGDALPRPIAGDAAIAGLLIVAFAVAAVAHFTIVTALVALRLRGGDREPNAAAKPAMHFLVGALFVPPIAAWMALRHGMTKRGNVLVVALAVYVLAFVASVVSGP